MNISRHLPPRGALLLCALFSTIAVAENDCPGPEEYLERGDPAGYTKAAGDFLQQHPDSGFAPRVAFDALMVATVFPNQPEAANMRRLLALNYPRSLQARYFRSTFANAGDYRQLLSGFIDEFSRAPSPGFPERFTQGLGAALDDFGDSLLDDSEFLLESAYLLQAAGEVAGQEDLLARLKPRLEQNDDLARIAGIAADSEKSQAEKAMELHALSAFPTAQLLRNLLLFQMTEDEREAPAMRQISAEAAIQDKRFADALALLEKQQAADHGDKVLFQRAWSHAALGQPDEARALLDQLETDYPDSPWVAPARALKASQEQYALRRPAFANALISTAQAFAELEALEGTLFYTQAPNSPPITVYLAIDLGKNTFEAQLRRADTLELAYRTAADGAVLYTRGDTVLRRSSMPGPVPLVKVGLEPRAEGGFHFNFSANLAKDFDDLIQDNNTLLDSPFLKTREGADELLGHLRQSGYLLGEVAQVDGQTILTLLQPDARDPEAISSSRFHLNESGQLVGLTIGDIAIRDMRYGASDSMRFSPPEWPSLETVMTEDFDAGLFANTMDNLAQMFIVPNQK